MENKVIVKMGGNVQQSNFEVSLTFRSKNARSGGLSPSIFSFINLSFTDLKIALRECILSVGVWSYSS